MLHHIYTYFCNKYHKTPHIVTASDTLTNSDKNLCEVSLQTFSKHLVS